MHRVKLLGAFSLLIVIALFIYGAIHLLILRFEKGDVYPPYSSYRSDPLGTKAFYEALGLLRGVETMRQVEPLQERSGLPETTLFLFGARTLRFPAMQEATLKALEEGVLGGGRIVISFVPTHAEPGPPSKEKKREECPQDEADKEKDEEERLLGMEIVNLTKRWGVKAELSAKGDGEASLSIPEKELPSSLPWHSTLVFVSLDPAWRILYTRAEKPVLIERSYGKGSIVLSSDSFFLSNEAMKKERYPQLLSWFCGPHRKIVFDETHLGVSKSPGIATLLRKYGLAPFFISLIVLALLAIWKQATRLVPVYEEEEKATVDAGKDAFTGFTNLLRRNLPPDHLLSACLEEWKRSFTHGKQDFSSRLPQIQEIIAADRAQPKKNRNPVEAYRKISALGRQR
jgi:hypothetical protein